ncbi:MAG: hypothetical protein KGO02_21470 [Alphaproteobacteria bacterium]|nr:hypothetical protein [Alphaproteobacteria bacterium]
MLKNRKASFRQTLIRIRKALGTRSIAMALLAGLFVTRNLPADAKSPDVARSPAAVMSEYCALDAKGARLSSQNPLLNTMFSLVTWPEEPGWDSVHVIKKFAILGSHSKPTSATVTVGYAVLGQLSDLAFSRSSTRHQVVTFVLIKSGNEWRIQRPMIEPHISVEAAMASLRSLLIDEKDAQRREQIRETLSVLGSLKSVNKHYK